MTWLTDVGSALALITKRHPPREGIAHSFSLNGDGELVLTLALPDEFLFIALGAEALELSPTDLAVEANRMVQDRRRLHD